MKSMLLCWLLACCMLANGASARTAPKDFSFGVIAKAANGDADESALSRTISETNNEDLAFVVANGIKSASEPCTDELYNRRKAIFDRARNGLIVSLAGSDWATCKRENGKSAAIERLNRVRELFFSDDSSFGASEIPLIRQSATPKFREYGENARWEVNGMMFATVSLPAGNNHYLSDAGRNSEFEDRLIANQDWLHRIFLIAKQKKLRGIVLFCDGNPFAPPAAGTRRDGFAEVRRKIGQLATGFSGKVLIIHGQANASATQGIAWRHNLGILDAGPDWLKITVNPKSATLFSAQR